MKKTTLLLAGIFVFLIFGGTAFPLTINGDTEVGAVDGVIASTTITPSYENQLSWIQRELGDEYTITEKYDVYQSGWTQVDSHTSLYAHALRWDPGYFFVKLGTGGSGILQDHWLYRNEVELSWAVVNISAWGGNRTVNIGRVSHIGQIATATVPEPATVILLGAGLLGLVAYKRKKA